MFVQDVASSHPAPDFAGSFATCAALQAVLHDRRKALALAPVFAYSPITMSVEKQGRQRLWTSHAAKLLGASESALLVVIGVALVLVALLLLYSSMHDFNEAVHQGTAGIEGKAIQVLNTVLLVMMTMEIVYTVAISLESHTLKAEPFLLIRVIPAIRLLLWL